VTSLDNLTGFWIPNTYYLYGDKLKQYNLVDTRTLSIQKRIMMTVNDLHPNCYMISKVLDMVPKGLLKLSMKQDDFDAKRDNIALKVCDYYNDTGDVVIQEPVGSNDPCLTSEIKYMTVDSDGEMIESASPYTTLVVGETYYWRAIFSDEDVAAQWRIRLIDEDDSYTEKQRLELERLMVIRDVDNTTISLRPGKSNRIKGLKFKLIVCDINGDYESAIELEVANT
jgi:hypothetical protein